MDFVADSGVLADTPFKLRSKALAEQNDGHPAIAGQAKLRVGFERGAEGLLGAAWWCCISSDLGANSIKVCIPEWDPEEPADLSDTV